MRICAWTWEFPLQRCLSLRHNPKYSQSQQLWQESPHLSLSCQHRVGRHSWSLPKNLVYVGLQHSITQRKNNAIVGGVLQCKTVINTCLKEWKIQIHQSQINGFPNKSSTDRRRVFWLPICSSHSALRQWCRGFLRISRPLWSAPISSHLHLALLKGSHFGYKSIHYGLKHECDLSRSWQQKYSNWEVALPYTVLSLILGVSGHDR